MVPISRPSGTQLLWPWTWIPRCYTGTQNPPTLSSAGSFYRTFRPRRSALATDHSKTLRLHNTMAPTPSEIQFSSHVQKHPSQWLGRLVFSTSIASRNSHGWLGWHTSFFLLSEQFRKHTKMSAAASTVVPPKLLCKQNRGITQLHRDEEETCNPICLDDIPLDESFWTRPVFISADLMFEPNLKEELATAQIQYAFSIDIRGRLSGRRRYCLVVNESEFCAIKWPTIKSLFPTV